MLDFQMGPFLIQGSYIILLVSLIITVLISYVLLTFYKISHKKIIINEWVQSILLVIIIWKFSYILTHPIQAFQYPLRLIYFDGGPVGWIVGVIVAFVVYKKALTKRDIQPPVIQNTFAFSGFIMFGAYQALTTFIYTVFWQEALFGLYYITLASLFFFSERLHSNRSAIRLGQWAVAGWIGHDMISGSIHMNDWTIWGAFVVGVFLLILDFRLDKGSEKNA